MRVADPGASIPANRFRVLRRRGAEPLVLMPMMNVGKVRMAVAHFRMRMHMVVRLGPVPLEVMSVLMMLIVGVRVTVLQRLVTMIVNVTLSEVDPNTQAHQRGRHTERP